MSSRRSRRPVMAVVLVVIGLSLQPVLSAIAWGPGLGAAAAAAEDDAFLTALLGSICGNADFAALDGDTPRAPERHCDWCLAPGGMAGLPAPEGAVIAALGRRPSDAPRPSAAPQRALPALAAFASRAPPV